MLINSHLCALATQLGLALSAQKSTLVTAESCTGGAIAAAITAVSGSSAWFEMGIVSYSNAVKHSALHVPEHLLASHGAVSAPVVTAMAKGALQQSGAHFAIAVSGIAGPDGGSIAKPVGTLWFAVGSVDNIQAIHRHFNGDRDSVREQAVAYGLSAMLQHLNCNA